MYVICASIISCAPGITARTSLIAASSSMLRGPALPDVTDEYLTAFECYALIVLQRLELSINDLVKCPVRCNTDLLLEIRNDPTSAVHRLRYCVNGYRDVRARFGLVMRGWGIYVVISWHRTFSWAAEAAA